MKKLKKYLSVSHSGTFLTSGSGTTMDKVDAVEKSYQLRHSYATHVIDNGASHEVIQSLRGREKSETTRIYTQHSGKLRYDLYNKYF
ncbi:tyrosine-type recombinase/integrase [Sporosarcina sp. D27]|uniref:tyrosine-type recombinase/integrase n=1 Tax=Sporosarcina sp. D27 TaxID=1382305 RepID=UPI000472E4AC|nr:tyrosine-type recombinase/integrase [Sporosarcina sp. D27]